MQCPLPTQALRSKSLEDLLPADEHVHLHEEYRSHFHSEVFRERCVGEFTSLVGPNKAKVATDSMDRFAPTSYFGSLVDTVLKECATVAEALTVCAADGSISIKWTAAMLDKAKQEGHDSTVYSNVYDLKARTVYTYVHQDFRHPVIFRMDAELGKRESVHDLNVLARKDGRIGLVARITKNLPKTIRSLVVVLLVAFGSLVAAWPLYVLLTGPAGHRQFATKEQGKGGTFVANVIWPIVLMNSMICFWLLYCEIMYGQFMPECGSAICGRFAALGPSLSGILIVLEIWLLIVVSRVKNLLMAGRLYHLFMIVMFYWLSMCLGCDTRYEGISPPRLSKYHRHNEVLRR